MNAAEKISDLDMDSFNYLRSRLQSVAGIHLSNGKHDLMRGRLRKRLAQLNLSSYSEYVEMLKRLPDTHSELEVFVNNMTTNKTEFFREAEHFNYLTKELLPKFHKQGKVNIWCAASSTGEEPYTLGLVMHEYKQAFGLDYAITASDIDTNVLRIAKNGVYQKTRLNDVPTQYQKKGFVVGQDGLENWVKVKSKIKQSISFEQCNLTEAPGKWLSQFDIIFCRNVLIYFRSETVLQVSNNLYANAKQGAYLLIGHSESFSNIKTKWDYIKPSVYYKRGK